MNEPLGAWIRDQFTRINSALRCSTPSAFSQLPFPLLIFFFTTADRVCMYRRVSLAPLKTWSSLINRQVSEHEQREEDVKLTLNFNGYSNASCEWCELSREIRWTFIEFWICVSIFHYHGYFFVLIIMRQLYFWILILLYFINFSLWCLANDDYLK